MKNKQGFLQSKGFAENRSIAHGFATSAVGDATTPEQARKVIMLLGLNPQNLQLMRQVHKDGIVDVNSIIDPRPEADALITTIPGIILGIRTADCVPVLIYDPENGVVAAVHSGWRSAAANISTKTLTTMNELYGSSAGKCQVAIGPAIGVCCYEVGEEVLGSFESRYIMGKNRLDLTSAVIGELENAGVQRSQIFWVNKCTHCDSKLFYSHRRDKECAGRHLSFITLCSQ